MGKLKDDEVESALLRACEINGLIRDKGIESAMATIQSARAGGFAKPRGGPTVRNQPHRPAAGNTVKIGDSDRGYEA
jgi:hypothetical protein